MTSFHRPFHSGFRYTPLAAGLALALSLSTAPVLGTPEHRPAPARALGSDSVRQMAHWLAEHPVAGRNRPSGGTTWLVTNCSDSGTGSLRALVTDPATVSGDSIDLSHCSEIALDGPLVINQSSLALFADSALTTVVYGGGLDGLLSHTGDGTLSITRLSLKFGTLVASSAATARGGCVRSSGAVAISAAVIEGCTVRNQGTGYAEGGGVYAAEGLYMVSSVVTGNHAIVGASGEHAIGGGISSRGGFACKYSTIEYNTATSEGSPSSAGGVFSAGAAFVQRCTIARNTANSVGGLKLLARLDYDDQITLLHTTISGNVATGPSITAGALIGTSGIMTINNNTVTNNFTTVIGTAAGLRLSSACWPCPDLNSNVITGNWIDDGSGLIASDFGSDALLFGQDNLIGIAIAGTDLGFLDNTIRQADAPFGPLADNGGPTPTHVPGSGSWVFNLGSFTPNNAFDPNTDQRGMPRSVGAGVDIGAVETDALFIGRFEEPPTSLP